MAFSLHWSSLMTRATGWMGRAQSVAGLILTVLSIGCDAPLRVIDGDIDATPAEVGTDPYGKADFGGGVASFGRVNVSDVQAGGIVPLYDAFRHQIGELDLASFEELASREEGALLWGPSYHQAGGKSDELQGRLNDPCSPGHLFPSECPQQAVTAIRYSGRQPRRTMLLWEKQYPDGRVERPYADRSWWGWGHTLKVTSPTYRYTMAADGTISQTSSVIPSGAEFYYPSSSRFFHTGTTTVNGELIVVTFVELLAD